VEVASTDDVQAAGARLAGAGLATATEENTDCCYAVQDKVWVSGPDGEPWEVYTVKADSPVPQGDTLRATAGACEDACACGAT
jgi:hypothetical protein